MAGKPRQREEDKAPIPVKVFHVEHAIRPELMVLDLTGQRAREMEIINLLTDIRELLRNGK